jgi:hypothetical protein
MGLSGEVDDGIHSLGRFEHRHAVAHVTVGEPVAL